MTKLALPVQRPTTLQFPAPRWVFAVALLALAAYGLGEAVMVYIWYPLFPTSIRSLAFYALIRIPYAILTGAAIVAFSRSLNATRIPKGTVFLTTACAFAISIVIAQLILQAFPNSGDEYGYNYLADTLLHGRLWNPSISLDLKDTFQTLHIADHDGRRISQYPPGWPAVLGLFKVAGIAQYANATIGLISCIFLWRALLLLRVPNGVRVSAFILYALAPFTLFNNASYFSHPLTAACLLAIIWLDLRDIGVQSAWNRAGIGLAFSILLTTRYEAFLIAFALFVCDGLARKRSAFFSWAAPAVLGGMPVTACFLWYNWKITGTPFETTQVWAFPEFGFGLHARGIEGVHSLGHGLAHTAGWAASWQDFASVIVVPLYLYAVVRRIAARQLRWFDLLLPCLVVFFVFYPDFGGFQYGPRYWYLGYVALPVTIAAGLPFSGSLWTLGRWRVDPVRMALLQLAAFAGFTIGYSEFLRLQTDLRILPLSIAETAPKPALVLMPDMRLRYVSWQLGLPPRLQSADYTRNGVDNSADVMIGNYLGGDQTARLCKHFPGRHVFILRMQSPPPSGHLEHICN